MTQLEFDLVGKRVVVATLAGEPFRGRVLAYSAEPTVLVEQDNGLRIMLPARNAVPETSDPGLSPLGAEQ